MPPVLRLGDSGGAVADLRRALASLGLIPSEILLADADAVFDAQVDRAVRAFQQGRQLIVDGLVGPATQRALLDARWKLGDRTLTFTLSSPMSGDDVTMLQTTLASLGYNTGRADGVFGSRTDDAVRQFQRDSGLADDGVFGAGTAGELGRLTRRQLVTGGRPQYLREQQQVRASGPRLRGKRIVIDPAHGGTDPGWVVGSGDRAIRAADLCYDLARRLESRMTATGMETFLTRGPQTNPTAQERAGLANTLAADLLLSLHVDGLNSPLGNGIATFHFGTDSGGTSTLGESLAGLIHRELVARTRLTDCRVHHGAWELLTQTQMPAVQVEIGYLTNPGDRELLLDSNFRNKVVEGILVAVKRLYLDGRDEPHTGTYNLADLMAHERTADDARA